MTAAQYVHIGKPAPAFRLQAPRRLKLRENDVERGET